MPTATKYRARLYENGDAYEVGYYGTLEEKNAAVEGAKRLSGCLKQIAAEKRNNVPPPDTGMVISRLNRMIGSGLFDTKPELLKEAIFGLRGRLQMIESLKRDSDGFPVSGKLKELRRVLK
jgi:hypothetical protein